MKRAWFVALLIALVAIVGCAGEAAARETKDVCAGPLGSIMNKCVNTDTYNDNYEPFDYGTYLHFILFESEEKDWEIGLWNTYEFQRDEFTTLFGGKIYLNRLFWQKAEK